MSKLPAKLSPISPGELLFYEFLLPMEITQNRLASEIQIPAQRPGELLAGRVVIDPILDGRLCRFFSLTEGYWLRAQELYEADVAANGRSA